MTVTKSFVSSFILALFLALLSFNQQVRAQNFVTQEGFPVEIRLRADQETIMLNEPAYIYLHIKNLSPHKLCVSEGGDYRNALGRPDSFHVKVTRDDGQPVPQPKIGIGFGGIIGCSPIPAGESHSTALLLPHWATFESTGIYDITVSKPLGVTNVDTKTQNTFEASANLRIEVISVDQIKLNKLIDSLGGLILDAKYPDFNHAFPQLSYLKSQQSFDYLAKALTKFANAAPDSNEERVRRGALSLLAEYDDDATMALFEKYLHCSDEKARDVIAHALSMSHHPQAAKLLPKMVGDSYWFVRLRVAQELSGKRTKESLAILETLSIDENEHVRTIAQSALDKLKQP